VKPNKENIITKILILLEKGTTYTDCHKVILSKFKLSEPTFVSYWKTANERHLINQQATQKLLAEQSTIEDLERLKIGILDKTDALKILTDIANGKVEKVEEGKLPPFPTRDIDRISAIKTISDLQGWNSPIKTDNTTTNLNAELTKEDIDKIAKGLNDKY